MFSSRVSPLVKFSNLGFTFIETLVAISLLMMVATSLIMIQRTINDDRLSIQNTLIQENLLSYLSDIVRIFPTNTLQINIPNAVQYFSTGAIFTVNPSFIKTSGGFLKYEQGIFSHDITLVGLSGILTASNMYRVSVWKTSDKLGTEKYFYISK